MGSRSGTPPLSCGRIAKLFWQQSGSATIWKVGGCSKHASAELRADREIIEIINIIAAD